MAGRLQHPVSDQRGMNEDVHVSTQGRLFHLSLKSLSSSLPSSPKMPNFAQLSLLGLLAVSAALAETRYYNFTIHAGEAAPGIFSHLQWHWHRVEKRALADSSTDGFSRPVYLINGQQPAPLIEVDEGDTLEVFVKNDLLVETTLHWHGALRPRLNCFPTPLLTRRLPGILQRGTPDMDGVPGVSQVSRSRPSRTSPCLLANVHSSIPSRRAAISPIASIWRMSMAFTGITRTFALTITMRSAGLSSFALIRHESAPLRHLPPIQPRSRPCGRQSATPSQSCWQTGTINRRM